MVPFRWIFGMCMDLMFVFITLLSKDYVLSITRLPTNEFFMRWDSFSSIAQQILAKHQTWMFSGNEHARRTIDPLLAAFQIWFFWHNLTNHSSWI